MIPRMFLLCLLNLACKGPKDQDSGPPLEPALERPSNTTCLAGARPVPGSVVLAVEDRYPGVRIRTPVALGKAPGQPGWWTVASQAGVLYRFADDPAATELEVLLDLRDRVVTGSEMGLLGFAYDPDFANNGELYVYYSAELEGQHTSIVARFVSADGGASFDVDGEEVVFTLEQPGPNHNGGGMHFDPTGALVIGLGDGGVGADPLAAQDMLSLLGSFVRIDVHPSDGAPYGIPADNPWVGVAGVAPELWAKGLRNPWGWGFDRQTGELWAGDVGWNDHEEVNRVEAGGNYGWPVWEGELCLRESMCEDPKYLPPVTTYGHDLGRAITGGRVYRGLAMPDLVGSFVYADYAYGTVWAVAQDPVSGEPVVSTLVESGLKVSSFAEDASGELFVLDNRGEGGVYALVPAASSTRQDLPAWLSETGCVDPLDPTQPAAGLIPYSLNAPFWSDGADKERWLALPDGTTIAVADDGDLELPVGSVVVKTFRVDGEPVETRLLVRHEDGEWGGYSYAWEGGDAALLLGSARRTLRGGQSWWYPSRAECLVCHTVEAGRSLGLELAQLDRPHTLADGREVEQLAAWVEMGLIGEALPAVEALPDPEGAAPLEDRARATLHTSCAPCHRPGSFTRDELDLRYSVPFLELGACEVAPVEDDLDIEGAVLLAPGDAARSLVAVRMGRRDVHGMPPIGSLVVDAEGLARVEAWIAGLSGCEGDP